MTTKALSRFLDTDVLTTAGANNGATSYIISLGSSGATWLDLDGRRIIGAPSIPTSASELSSKSYVDTQIASVTAGAGSLKESLLSSAQLNNTQGVRPAFAIYLVNGNTAGATEAISVVSDTHTVETFTEGTEFTGQVSASADMSALADAINAGTNFGAKYCADLDAFNATDGVVVVYSLTTPSSSDDLRAYSDSGTSNFRIVSFQATTATDNTPTSPTANYELENIGGDFAINQGDPGTDVDYSGVFYQVASLTEPQTHWSLNENQRYTWDADASQWNLSASNDVPDAGQGSGGGTKGILSVDTDFGLELDATNNALRINLEASAPSLQFSSGELGVKINAAGGLEKNASGLGINTDSTGGTTAINGSNELEVSLRTGSGLQASSGLGLELDATTSTSSGLRIDNTNGVSVKLVSAGAGTGGLEYAAADAGIQVDAGDGIVLDADGVNVDLASSGGLEMSTTGGSGQVQINVDATGGTTTINGSNELAVAFATNGGLEASSGAKVIPGDGIALDADGVNVDLAAAGGLELSTTGGSGQVQINVDATGGTTTINGSNELVAHSEVRVVEEITLTGTDITNEYAATSLTNTPADATAVSMRVQVGGASSPPQRYTVDFTIVTDGSNDRRITWTDAGGAGNPTTGMVGDLQTGDILIVEYTYFN